MDAEAWNERYRSEPALWGEANPVLAPFLEELAPGAAVDLACGNGRHTSWLATRGWDATGVDFADVAIEQGRQRTPEATWVVADVLTWQPDRPLDLVLIGYLHLPPEQSRQLIGRALGWLAPGGRLVLLAHAHANLAHGVGGPQDGSLLPRVGDLADTVDTADPHEHLLVRRLQHVERRTDAGTAIDLLLVVDRRAGVAGPA